MEKGAESLRWFTYQLTLHHTGTFSVNIEILKPLCKFTGSMCILSIYLHLTPLTRSCDPTCRPATQIFVYLPAIDNADYGTQH